jgi:DNA-binding NarL/FixJ family response regulator
MAIAADTLQLVLVEDHPAVSAGVERLISRTPDMEVAAVADTCAAAAEISERVRPDAVIVDMHLVDGNGLRLAHDLIDRGVTGAVVVYTAFADDLVALAALVAGASAVVSKGALGAELIDAVRASARGARLRPRITIDGLVEAAGAVAPEDVPILGMLVHGTPAADVAGVLGVSEKELAGRRRRMLRALIDENP